MRGVQRLPESVPPSVRADLEPQLGASLGDVKVHRGPDATAAAQAVQAKAFAAGGEVVLPDEHGSMSSGEGRKILSHELTHVVQQRALGTSLPPEDSADGQRLEAQARAVGGQDPVPTRPVPRPARPGPRQRLADPDLPTVTRPLAPVAPSPTVPPTAPSGSSTTPASPASQTAIATVVQQAALAAGIPSTPVATPGGSTTAGPPNGLQRLADGPSATPTASPAPTTSHVTAPRPPAESQHDRVDVDDLARQLYPKFRARLRSDLLLDRERSGRLFDGAGR